MEGRERAGKRSIRGSSSSSSSPRSSRSVVRSNRGTGHTHTGLFRDVYQQTARWVSTADVGACARARAQLRLAYLVERTKLSSARRAWKETSEQPMLWGTLDNLDMNTSYPVLTVRPDSPALQAILQYLSCAWTQHRGFRRRGKAGYTCSGSTVTKQSTDALQSMAAFALRGGGGQHLRECISLRCALGGGRSVPEPARL